MKKQNKKILSLLMALVMCLSLLPSVAFAAGTVSNEEQLTSAIVSGGTVQLANDITLTSPLTISNAVTIDGTSNKYGITFVGTDSQYTITITSPDVTLQNLTINKSKTYNGVNVNATGAKIINCDINASRRGVNFYLENSGNNPKLDITGTTIKNANVGDNYNMTADYGADNRGVATGNIKGGEVNITGCSILGFKYSINPVVDAENGLRDGNGTTFNISNSTIKGWTALNIWSANTTFSFTDCTLTGINALTSGSTNNYSTIVANDDIYGNVTNGTKSSVVNINGGTVQAVQLKGCAEAAFNVDNQFQTKFNFDMGNDLSPVVIQVYFPEDATNSVGIWNFYWLYANDTTKINKYFADMVTGTENATGTFLPSSDWENQYNGASAAFLMEDDDALTRYTGSEGHVGGGAQ